MKKKSSVILMIVGMIFIIVGMVTLYFKYASEIYFTCAIFCILESIVLGVSNKHIASNIGTSLLLAFAILSYIVSGWLIPMFVLAIFAIILAVLFRLKDRKYA